MKKFTCICLAALLALSTLAGCSTARSDAGNANDAPTGKVVINFEGTVATVNGDEITLENGKIITISSDTVFAGDLDTNNAVSEEIAAGNFIQGYTEDDPDGDRLSASKIYCNTAVEPDAGKLAINFEGTVAAVEGNRITLEGGQAVLISDDTIFSIASGVVENVILSEGCSIQGCTADDPTASEITASRIHMITY